MGVLVLDPNLIQLAMSERGDFHKKTFTTVLFKLRVSLCIHDISCYSHAKQLIEDTIRRNASPIRLEQPDKERMGGSSSSLNSSASDESNRFPGEFGFNRICFDSRLLYYNLKDKGSAREKFTMI